MGRRTNGRGGNKEPIPLTIVIVGDGGTGKSSITLSFIRREFLEEYDPTIEDSYSTSLVVDGQEYNIEIIDTAGQEEYRGLWGENTVKHGDAFIVVYSIDSKPSFNAIPDFLQTIRNVKNVEFIDDEEEEIGTDTGKKNNCFPFALVGNKCDLEETRQVSLSQGSAFASHCGGLFSETSAKTGLNVESTFESLIRSTMRVKRARERHPNLIPNIAVVEGLMGLGEEERGKEWEGVTVEEEVLRLKKNVKKNRERRGTGSGIGSGIGSGEVQEKDLREYKRGCCVVM